MSSHTCCLCLSDSNPLFIFSSNTFNFLGVKRILPLLSDMWCVCTQTSSGDTLVALLDAVFGSSHVERAVKKQSVPYINRSRFDKEDYIPNTLFRLLDKKIETFWGDRHCTSDLGSNPFKVLFEFLHFFCRRFKSKTYQIPYIILNTLLDGI